MCTSQDADRRKKYIISIKQDILLTRFNIYEPTSVSGYQPTSYCIGIRNIGYLELAISGKSYQSIRFLKIQFKTLHWISIVQKANIHEHVWMTLNKEFNW